MYPGGDVAGQVSPESRQGVATGWKRDTVKLGGRLLAALAVFLVLASLWLPGPFEGVGHSPLVTSADGTVTLIAPAKVAVIKPRPDERWPGSAVLTAAAVAPRPALGQVWGIAPAAAPRAGLGAAAGHKHARAPPSLPMETIV